MDISSLPDEVLILVMENLDYFDLKSCMRVSDEWRHILTMSSAFDRPLFRKSVGKRDLATLKYDSDEAPESLQFHPLLEQQVEYLTNYEDDWQVLVALARLPDGRSGYTVEDSRNELATFPAVDRLPVWLVSRWVYAENAAGVTVRDVLAMLRYPPLRTDIIGCRDRGDLPLFCAWPWRVYHSISASLWPAIEFLRDLDRSSSHQ